MNRQQEAHTVACMIQIYCRGRHRKKQLCPSCQELLEITRLHLSECPPEDDRPFFSSHTIQCFKPEQREEIEQMLGYSGPRLLWHHPMIAIRYMVTMSYEKGRGRV